MGAWYLLSGFDALLLTARAPLSAVQATVELWLLTAPTER